MMGLEEATMEDEQLMGARQAQELLGISRGRIHQLARRGDIGRKVDGRWLFTRAELEAFKAIPRRAGRPKEGESET